MPLENNRFFVLTGGPGAGKTTVLDRLRTAGYAATVEAGRGIIQDQVAIDGPALPWRDRHLFAEQMLTWEMRSYAIAARTTGTVFFDRGVPDIVGYLTLCGIAVPPHAVTAARHFRYHPRVFVFPPWRDIFHQDAERKQDFTEAERTFSAVSAAYTDFGYEPVPVPLGTPADRTAFILENIGT